MLDEPGLIGLQRDEARSVSLLVLDDRALPGLQRVLRGRPGGVINVLRAAPASRDALVAVGGWSAKAVEVMVSRDLSRTPTAPLPEGLRLEPLRLAGDRRGREPELDSAARLVVRADPTVNASAEQLATSIRALSPPPVLFAAVDAEGTIRATSGYRLSGTDATVLFVNTDIAWRRRGIGRAMTAIALEAAYDAGARSACLGASDAGASIYRSLRFESAGPATQFSRAADVR